jgi:peptidyl-prolyl cis-trans isomerase SurA
MPMRWIMLGLLLLGAVRLWAGEVLDRIVANVNGHVILQSDFQEELRYECFMTERPLSRLTTEDRKATLDRIIDQELLREQIRAAEIKPAGPDDIDKQIERVKDDYLRNHNAASWDAALLSYSLTEAGIRNHVAFELDQLRLVEVRLRPSVQIDASSIETYYKEQLLPQLIRSGGAQISLAQAAPKIRELLIQQQINQLLTSWLESLRSQAQIRVFVPESPEPRVQTE